MGCFQSKQDQVDSEDILPQKKSFLYNFSEENNLESQCGNKDVMEFENSYQQIGFFDQSCMLCRSKNDNVEWRSKAIYMINQYFSNFQWSHQVKQYFRQYKPNANNLLNDSTNYGQLQLILKKYLKNRQKKTESLKDLNMLIEHTDIIREQMFSLQNLSFHDFSQDSPEKSFLEQRKHTNTIMIDVSKVREVNKDVYEQIKIYKQLTRMINQQLKKENHPIGNILRIFQEYIQVKGGHKLSKESIVSKESLTYYGSNIEIQSLQKFYSLYSVDSNARLIDDSVKSNKQLQNDLKSFLSFFYQLIWDYYQINKISVVVQKLGESQFTSENLSNFLCSLLFENQQFYDTVIRSYLAVDEEYINMFNQVIQYKSKQSIDNFDMADQFKLNESSLNVQLLPGFERPYKSAIYALKKIDNVNPPIQKLKVILKSQQEMDNCIQNFYINHDCVPKKYDADQLLYIMVYIIIKSEIKYLPIYCKMMEHLLVKDLMTGPAGYLIITIQSCIHYIITQYGNSVFRNE